MSLLDWLVILGYLGALLYFARRIGQSHNNSRDYYLAGSGLRWWQSGLSTMATQLSAVSFVSAPAFVALKQDGGLKWLSYELAVPLGLLLVITIIIPAVKSTGSVSIYSFFEKRFDRHTASLVALLFLIGRALATSIIILTGALVISTALSISTWMAIIIIGIVTVLADAWGGLKIVVYSDIVQMFFILIGMGICAYTAYSIFGWEQIINSFPEDRAQILDFTDFGLTAKSTYGFWPMVLGGLFLYASYYGCDQSQMQRELAVKTVEGSRYSLLFNALLRFPLVLLYCLTGVFVGAAFTVPELQLVTAGHLDMGVSELTQTLTNDPDRMLPLYILGYLPAGIRGLLFVAILSALMSSLDSSINSLSAVTQENFIKAYSSKTPSDEEALLLSKRLTLYWGGITVLGALWLLFSSQATQQTSIVLINAVGSAMYGPVLAAFLLGILFQGATSGGVKIGILTGLTTNFLLWQLTSISWLWWNCAGCLVAIGATLLLGNVRKKKSPFSIQKTITTILITYFFILIGCCLMIERLQ